MRKHTKVIIQPRSLSVRRTPIQVQPLAILVDGASVTSISLDTSTTSTHTIVYSAIDGASNWGFETRTVNVVAQ